MLSATPNPNDFTGAQSQQDEGLLVKFYLKPRIDKEETKKEGREIYKDVEYIDIRMAGTRSGGAARPATKEDKQRFHKHYAAFKDRLTTEDLVEGTLLSEWALVSRARVEELAFINVKTVEQLAAMADNYAGQMMGLMDLKQKAKAWLDATKENHDVVELRTQISNMEKSSTALDDRNTRLEEKNDEMEQRLNDLALKLLEFERKETIAENKEYQREQKKKEKKAKKG